MFKTDSYTKHTTPCPLDGHHFAQNSVEIQQLVIPTEKEEFNISLQRWFHFFTFKHEAFHGVAEDSWLIRFNCAL